MKIAALIFDFDGLIIDTEQAIFQSWQELYQTYHRQLDLEQWLQTIGTMETSFDPAKELERELGHSLDWQIIEPNRQFRETELIHALPVLPGVEALLISARKAGLKIALASSSHRDWVVNNLTRLGLIDYFDHLVTCDEVNYTKPDPELFLSALSALGLKPGQAIVFEDSPNGVLAAKRAGLFVVAVPGQLTRNQPIQLADLKLDSLADVNLAKLLSLVEAEG